MALRCSVPKTFGRVGLVLALGVLGASSAQAQKSPATPFVGSNALFDTQTPPLDIKGIPLLNALVKQGATLHYLGARSGLRGWLILKDGQLQMAYATSDGKTILVGGLFTEDGENVSSVQIKNLADTDPNVRRLLDDAIERGRTLSHNEGGDTSSANAESIGPLPGQAPSSPEATATALAKNLPTVPTSPGERLYQDFKRASSISVGAKDNKAEVLMVISASCPYCKEVWKMLRDDVKANKLQIRLIPVASAGENINPAARLLESDQPLEAWDKHVNGDASALSGTPAEVYRQAVGGNSNMVERWNINMTPYLVYRDKSGHVKIIQGVPAHKSDLLNDLPS